MLYVLYSESTLAFSHLLITWVKNFSGNPEHTSLLFKCMKICTEKFNVALDSKNRKHISFSKLENYPSQKLYINCYLTIMNALAYYSSVLKFAPKSLTLHWIITTENTLAFQN
jgi:hypothetical protein